MNYLPLFIVPSSIHKLRYEDINNDELILFDNLFYTIPYVKILEIVIPTKDRIIHIIDQFNHINHFLFICEEFSRDFFNIELCLSWFEENSFRLRMNHFKLQSDEICQEIQISIGGLKN